MEELSDERSHNGCFMAAHELQRRSNKLLFKDFDRLLELFGIMHNIKETTKLFRIVLINSFLSKMGFVYVFFWNDFLK